MGSIAPVKRILVVDEDCSFRSFLRSILEKNYEVFEADGAGEVPQLVAKVHPDLIVVDRDVWTVDADALWSTRVLRTMFKGKWVWISK